MSLTDMSVSVEVAPASVASGAASAADAELSPRTRGRLATRARLLEAAEGLFAEHGLHRVTTHQIARSAGVAAGTFYLHFRDKQDILREIVDTTIGDLMARLEAAWESAPDLRERVRAHSEAMFSFAEDRRDVMRILFSGDAEAAAVESDVLASLASSFEAGRREKIEAGEMPAEMDPAIVSQAVVGMWARVVAWWCEDPQRAKRDALVETLVRIQLSGTHPS
ncbi:MAG: TetR/AcrR family transcriptional regulator [Proteobacteria bacterium]|nr:TetR/AcrR family transcriptional regulator [Pseudomonadota bacterium]